MKDEKNKLKDKQFVMDDFRCKSAMAMGIGMLLGLVIGILFILVIIVKHFLF